MGKNKNALVRPYPVLFVRIVELVLYGTNERYVQAILYVYNYYYNFHNLFSVQLHRSNHFGSTDV